MLRKTVKIFVLQALIACGFVAQAQAPTGYYSDCEGSTGKALLTALHGVIGEHTVITYGDLWKLYATSDVYDNGKIWDMYSTKKWTYGDDQCGNYNALGDCYNREHSMPKSWFKDASPMYSDAFHIYPTDGAVNGQRSNYPFGECANGNSLSTQNGVKALGKLGTSTFPGYTGTVFEPDDQYKGDFARSYFYMATCYNDLISSWKSDMLAGNSYPAFSSWAIELLLKWHRQDPVSTKELNRNEAVAAQQDNRNPFIDHPELAEYIWGDKQGEAWYSNGAPTPELVLPVADATLDFGSTIPGMPAVKALVVKGLHLDQDVALSVSGDGFSVSPTSVSAAAANATDGQSVNVAFSPIAAGSYQGVLTVSCGELSSKVVLQGRAIASIPAGPVNSLSDCSFVATWTYVGDADANGEYTLDVRQDGVLLDAFPCSVKATDEYYLVEDLEPSTTYTYVVKSTNLSSDEVSVKTLDPLPSIAISYSGEMPLTAVAGEASEAIELAISSFNVNSDISVSVNEPFALSTDKANWVQNISLNPDEDHFYLQLHSAEAGTFRSAVTATYGDYVNDEFVVEGLVAKTANFFEDFEVVDPNAATYNGCTYQGTAAIWNFSDAGIWTSDKQYEGAQAVRMGKTATSTIEMAEYYAGGFGTVTLWAATFNKDAAATFVLEYATAQGDWTTAGTATAESSEYAQFTFTVNVAEPARMRVRQTDGKRFMIDAIEASKPQGGIADITSGLDGWDAFCRDGQIVLQADGKTLVTVYALDGVEVFKADIAGETLLDAPAGLYIVAAKGEARRVLVK